MIVIITQRRKLLIFPAIAQHGAGPTRSDRSDLGSSREERTCDPLTPRTQLQVKLIFETSVLGCHPVQSGQHKNISRYRPTGQACRDNLANLGDPGATEKSMPT